MKVLIVDDNSMIRNLLRLMLEHEQVDCATAEDGQDALEQCAAESFGAVISDLDMPRMNGAELAGVLRQRYPGMTLLAFSGSSGDAVWEDAGNVFDGMFRKPDARDVVEAAVRLARGEEKVFSVQYSVFREEGNTTRVREDGNVEVRVCAVA